MTWREPKNHINDCNFCTVETTGLNANNKASILYQKLQTTIRLMLHSTDIPVPVFAHLTDRYMVDNGDDCTPKDESAEDCDCHDGD